MEMFSKAEGGDLGKWYTIAKDPETGKISEFRIRRLPAAVARRLRRQKIKYKGDVTVIDVPQEEQRARAEAMECWTGVRNVTVKAVDEHGAAAYRRLCPGVDFPVGQEVSIDACLTDELKLDILTEFPETVAFIRKRAKALQVVDDEQEEEALGN